MTLNFENKIMLDLETMGLAAGCGILAVGACTFDGKHDFYMKILPSENAKYGLLGDPSTMRWHLSQPEAVRKENFSGTQTLQTVLGAFSDFMLMVERSSKDSKSITVWGNGADFDLPILKAAYAAVGMKFPVKPYNGRCYRTLKNLIPDIKMSHTSEGAKHTALADAQNQASHAVTLLTILHK